MTKRRLSTHQVIRISCWIDAIEAKQRQRRRCALMAAERGRRELAIYWSGWAMNAEAVLARLRRRLNEDTPC